MLCALAFLPVDDSKYKLMHDLLFSFYTAINLPRFAIKDIIMKDSVEKSIQNSHTHTDTHNFKRRVFELTEMKIY